MKGLEKEKAEKKRLLEEKQIKLERQNTGHDSIKNTPSEKKIEKRLKTIAIKGGIKIMAFFR